MVEIGRWAIPSRDVYTRDGYSQPSRWGYAVGRCGRVESDEGRA